MGYVSVFINAIIVALMAMYVYENERRIGEMSTRLARTGWKLSTLKDELDQVQQEQKAIQIKIGDMDQLLSKKAGIEELAEIKNQLLKTHEKGLEGEKKLSTLEGKLDQLKLDSKEEMKAIQVKINDMEQLLSTKAGIEKLAEIEKQQLKAQEKAVNSIIICERNSAFIVCNSHISILEAIYGRQTDANICPTLVKTSNCRSSASDGRVKHQCNGKSICELTASNQQFGDPCIGVGKYLEVKYTCT
ncbi:uncharacterized protein LOC127721501 [Mytilus californianus]|uniref:uncharacterized protein LOC127721501 n=1 Tax=Mytilus californianus TaxID=6549 RepID=UPI0022462124|nr:uncharacterized protein LOC127721501 [Mytilus californianus]